MSPERGRPRKRSISNSSSISSSPPRKNISASKKHYTLHDYRDHFPPCGMSPYIPSPLGMSAGCPSLQPQVMSDVDVNGTVPASDNAMDPPLGDFNFDAIFNSQDNLSLFSGPPLPTPPLEPVHTSLDKSQPDVLELGAPCLPPTQPTSSHQQPAQPLPGTIPHIYGDVPAMKEAILSMSTPNPAHDFAPRSQSTFRSCKVHLSHFQQQARQLSDRRYRSQCRGPKGHCSAFEDRSGD